MIHFSVIPWMLSSNGQLLEFSYWFIEKSCELSVRLTAQKLKFSIMNFFSKCDQIHRILWVWLYLLKKSSMENFIFCAVIQRSTENLFTHLGWTVFARIDNGWVLKLHNTCLTCFWIGICFFIVTIVICIICWFKLKLRLLWPA